MKIEQQRVGTVDVLTPIGPLVDQDGEKFVELLLGRTDAPNPRIVIAMHEVPYIDSLSLEGLLSAADALQERACNLKVAGVTSTCREILELTGLSAHLRFFRDVQGAVRSYL